DVDDREHHEDVGLQQHDQDVEDRPAQVENAAEKGAVNAARGPHPQQQENDFAGVDVAEEAQAVRQRLRYPLDYLEQEIEGPQQEVIAERRDEQFLGPAADALGLDAVDDHQRKHRERQRERGVDVGGGHDAPVVQADRAEPRRQDIDGQEVHRVHQDHPHEHGQRDRRDPETFAVIDALDLVVDEGHAELDERLRLRRHAGGGLARDPPHEPKADETEHDRRHDGVGIDAPEARVAHLLD